MILLKKRAEKKCIRLSEEIKSLQAEIVELESVQNGTLNLRQENEKLKKVLHKEHLLRKAVDKDLLATQNIVATLKKEKNTLEQTSSSIRSEVDQKVAQVIEQLVK